MDISNFGIVETNFLYAGTGVLTAILAMLLGYFIFELITPFNTRKELENQNIAVGIVIGSIFIGLGIAVGLVIGMGLN